jgi:hypothetical protein
MVLWYIHGTIGDIRIMSKKHGDNLFSTFSSGIMMNRELLEYTIFTQTHTGPEGVSICRAGVGILTMEGYKVM